MFVDPGFKIFLWHGVQKRHLLNGEKHEAEIGVPRHRLPIMCALRAGQDPLRILSVNRIRIFDGATRRQINMTRPGHGAVRMCA